MFRIIGIELLDAEDMLFDYLNQHPNVGGDNRQWMERFKKERYESVIRTLANDRAQMTYVLCHDYVIQEGRAIPCEAVHINKDFYKIGEISVNVNAIVGKNGSGKSTFLDIMLRLINNTAYALREGIDNNGSYELHYAECVFARLFIENGDGTISVIEQRDHNIQMYFQQNERIIWNFNNISGELKWTDENDVEERIRCQEILGGLFYTVVVNYSAYAFNINDYRSEWIDCDEMYLMNEFEGYPLDGDMPARPVDNDGYGFISDEEKCWIGSLFHKNDAYQTPIVLNPYRVRGNIDYNKEKELLNERIFLLLLDNREMVGALLGGKTPYSYIFREEEEFLPNPNYDCLFFSNKVYGALKSIGAFERLNRQEIISKTSSIANEIITSWEKCMGFRLVQDIAGMHRGQDNDGICALNYIVYKTVKVTNSYSKYRQNFRNDLCNGQNINRLVMNLYCDNTHITLKLRRALTFLIFRHYGTERIVNENERSNETLLEDFSRIVNQKIAGQQDIIGEIKRQRPMEEAYTAEDFLNLDLVPRGQWTREELLPTPSMDVTLRLHLGDDNYTGFNLLSSGEKQMIYTLGTTIYQLHNLNSAGAGAINYHSVNLIFDEIDLYFHPQYQKGLVKRILEMIGKMRPNHINHINIIFATHSPFILSDIHKNNILYLDNGIDTSFDVDTNPLGANINDILCQSFFLNDGFMGDYIKEKLLDLISYLHGDERQPNGYRWEGREEGFIDSIGDTFLKGRLRELYNENRLR